MNCQKPMPQIVKNILIKNNILYTDIYYYAYPQVMSNTLGIGPGGQSMSTHTIEAYVCDDIGPTVYIFNNYFVFDNIEFKPFKYIKDNEWQKV